MTIYGIPDGSSDDQWVQPMNPNRENMKDDQMEIGKLLNSNENADYQKHEQMDHNTYIFRDTVEELHQQEMVYKCVFHLEPDMVKYYCTPAPNVSRSLDGTPIPVLQGSPEFDGFYNTKWQISVNFNRWIGMHRWMSIYLTRVDENLLTFQAQFEFKLVDKNGLVVYSQKNVLSASGKVLKGMSIGFAKFLPFSDVAKHLIDGNKLSLEVHLVLFSTISTHNVSMENAHIHQGLQEFHLEGRQNDDDCFYCHPALMCENFPEDTLKKLPNSDIPREDRVLIQLRGIDVTYVRREKLKEKSPIYVQCLQNKWECMHVLNFPFLRESAIRQIRAIRDYVNFIHGQPCDTLKQGTYRDAQVLLQFALKFGTEEVARRCITIMSFQVHSENAADHSVVLQRCCEYLSQDDFDQFKNYFKDNFLAIRKTQRFQKLKETHSAFFISILFD